jgi:hypothetical protein
VHADSAGVLGRPLAVASVGVDLFAHALELQDVAVERVAWQPPEPAAADALARLALSAGETAQANDAAVERIDGARPRLVGVARAGDVIAGMSARTFLHAGPPIDWTDMSGPLRGAIAGAAVHEGLAVDIVEAGRRAAAGEFEFVPCHERGAVGPMAGVVGASMPMLIVENAETPHNRAYCTFNEGLGRVLRYGANDAEVLKRLEWMRVVLAPVFAAALAALGAPLDLRALTAQALQMGDEGHNRNRAGTSLLIRELTPALLELEAPASDVAAVMRFIAANDHFFLNLTMPMAKVAADAAAGIAGSSIVVAMARNGTEFGIRLSGTGDRWFTGPSGTIDGLYLPGFGPEDANPDIGRFVGGSPDDAIRATESMYEIAWSESHNFQIPVLGFRGTPVGIDCREVVRTRTVPVVNTGIAHREAGIGQIGAGLVKPPMKAFVDAVNALAAAT